MEAYLEHLPYFFVFTLLGIIVNLATKKNRKEKITVWRFIEEVFGSIWISALVLSTLDYFTDFSAILVSGLGSIAGYYHSKIIDKVGNDILVTLFKGIKNFITKKFNTDEQEDI